MFYIKEPSTLQKPWVLSHWRDNKIISIPLNVLKSLRNYHLMGIEFLYNNFNRKMSGAILNEEAGMNMPLQVCAFLNAIIPEKNNLSLIICPDKSICQWHYHLSKHANLKVVQIGENFSDNFETNGKIVLLLKFSSYKMIKNLSKNNFFAVIVDDFHKMGSKIIFRNFRGFFNIGLTERSFYMQPDQKLQWKMLNWANPDCVGKLNDFYEIDNDNFENYRDNYRFWWFRLTWNFCESFKKPTNVEIEEYEDILNIWRKEHNLINFSGFEYEKKSKKRASSKKSKENVQKKIKIDETKEIITENEDIINNMDKNDLKIIESSYVKLPSMDENPILSSIIKNFESSPDPVKSYSSSSHYEPYSCSTNEPNCSKAFNFDDEEEEENVILSIIGNENGQQANKDEPCSSKTVNNSDDEDENDFFSSLISSNDNYGEEFKIEESNLISDDDVRKILQDTQSLLED